MILLRQCLGLRCCCFIGALFVQSENQAVHQAILTSRNKIGDSVRGRTARRKFSGTTGVAWFG